MESLRQDDTTVYRIAVSDSLAYRPPRNKRHFDIRADSRYRTKVADPNVNLAFPAVNYLKQAMHHDKLSVYILSYSKNSFENNELYNNLFDELNQEKELFKEFSRYDSN